MIDATKNQTASDIMAVSTHSRVDWSDPTANELVKNGEPVMVVRTTDGKWIAVGGADSADIAEPVTVIQHMQSCDLRRRGLVWAVWDGVKLSGFWDSMPGRMPLYAIA